MSMISHKILFLATALFIGVHVVPDGAQTGHAQEQAEHLHEHRVPAELHDYDHQGHVPEPARPIVPDEAAANIAPTQIPSDPAIHTDLHQPHVFQSPKPISGEPDNEQYQPRRIHQMSEEDIEDFRRDVREFDFNKDGELDAEELREAFSGENVAQSQLFQFFNDVDLDDSGTVTMAEYIEYAVTLES